MVDESDVAGLPEHPSVAIQPSFLNSYPFHLSPYFYPFHLSLLLPLRHFQTHNHPISTPRSHVRYEDLNSYIYLSFWIFNACGFRVVATYRSICALKFKFGSEILYLYLLFYYTYIFVFKINIFLDDPW